VHGNFLYKGIMPLYYILLYFCRSLPEIDGLSKETVLTSWMAKFDCIFKGTHQLICILIVCSYTRVYPKVSGLSHNDIYAYNNNHSLRSNTKGYGSKSH